MPFDAFTFDEGIAFGGIRTKNEIRTLICYMFTTVNQNMTKDIIVNALLEKGLANYFEASSCFDDLVNANTIKRVSEDSNEYTYTDDAKLISDQLEDTLATTVKERACECALLLLEKTRIEKDNHVTIEKTDNGYNVCCTISGGEMDLLSFKIYCPEVTQARMIRKNFLRNPDTIYEIMVAMLTKNKKAIENILDSLYRVI